MENVNLTWVEDGPNGALRMRVDLSTYSLDALLRVCYLFTDRCYLFLTPDADQKSVTVHIAPKSADSALLSIVGGFSNELIDQQVRQNIAAQTKAIRELIVAQAFTETDLLDRAGPEGDYLDDPKGIAG
jgi:His-Xaa-Ser system protein HxsD